VAIEIPRGRKSRKRQAILEDTVNTMERRLELHIFPYLGGHDIGAVTGSDLLSTLRRLEEQGSDWTVVHVREVVGHSACSTTSQDLSRYDLRGCVPALSMMLRRFVAVVF
jgi:hypothetical protein